MCEVDVEHEPHTYAGALCPVRCSGSAKSRRHFLGISGDVKCSCGWRINGVMQWQYAVDRVKQHVDEHPDGNFGSTRSADG